MPICSATTVQSMLAQCSADAERYATQVVGAEASKVERDRIRDQAHIGGLTRLATSLAAQVELATQPAEHNAELLYVAVRLDPLGAIWIGCNYSPATQATDSEPGDSEDIEVCEVWLGGSQIGGCLEPSIVDEIESAALQAARQAIDEGCADAAIDVYQNRGAE